MAEGDNAGKMTIPERSIPLPAHFSPEMRAHLSQPRAAGMGSLPALDDLEGWRAHVAAADAAIMQSPLKRDRELKYELRELREGDALAWEIVPATVKPGDRRVYLDVHGGALIYGEGEFCRQFGVLAAARLDARVVAVDYRMPPDHPFPVGIDDCLAFYRALLRDHSPQEIIVGGGSAGGNVVAAMILKARDEGLPMPAAAVLGSPELDLTESGDSFATNAGIDEMGSLMPLNLLYAGGQPLDDPYVSPLFGDFSKGFPPTIVTAGTRDLFLSNAVRMHRALRANRIEAELHIMEGATHSVGGIATPEGSAIDVEIRGFCDAKWAGR